MCLCAQCLVHLHDGEFHNRDSLDIEDICPEHICASSKIHKNLGSMQPSLLPLLKGGLTAANTSI
jgi:hypothetical protein